MVEGHYCAQNEEGHPYSGSLNLIGVALGLGLGLDIAESVLSTIFLSSAALSRTVLDFSSRSNDCNLECVCALSIIDFGSGISTVELQCEASTIGL